MSKLKHPSLIGNAFSNWFVLILNMVVSFFLTPFIIRALGREEYGIWTVMISFIGYYGVLDLGIRSAVTRYIARYAGRRDYESLNETANTALMMFSGVGVIAAVLSFFIAGPFAVFLKITPVHMEDFRTGIRILGVATGVSFPVNVIAAIIQGHEFFIGKNIARATLIVSRTLMIILVLSMGYGISGMAFAYLVTYIIELGVLLLIMNSRLPHVKMSVFRGRLARLRTLMGFGIVAMIANIGTILRTNIASLVIMYFMNPAMVTMYRIPSLIIQYITSVQSSAFGVLAPRFSSLEGAGKKKQLSQLFERSLALSSLLVFGFASLVVAGGGQFIELWVGESFREAVPILWILASAVAFELFHSPGVNVLYALNKHRFFAWMNLVEGVLNLVFSLILVRYLGLIGVALGSVIALVIVKLFIMPPYYSKMIGISLFHFFKPMLLTTTAAAVVVYVAFRIGIISDWHESGSGENIFIIIGLALLYLILSLLLFRIAGIRLGQDSGENDSAKGESTV